MNKESIHLWECCLGGRTPTGRIGLSSPQREVRKEGVLNEYG